MKLKYLAAACLILGLAAGLNAQTPSNPQGGTLTASSTNCTVAQSCVWQRLPINANTSAITVAGTFSETLLVETSGDGGTTFVTQATLTMAGLTTYTVQGFSDIRVRVSAFVSGGANVTISTGLNTGLQGPAGPGGSGCGTLPTTPNSRAQVAASTPSGGVGQPCAYALPGDSPTDRPSGEASYTIGVTDIGTSIRETNASGEAFTIPDGNTSGFVLPVNIGFIVEGGTSTIARTTSSQIRCTPNGALANSCSLTVGAQYILKETSDFNYTLSVSGDSGAASAQNIHETDLLCGFNGTTIIGSHLWTAIGTGASFDTSSTVSSLKYPCGVHMTVGAASGDWNFFSPTNGNANFGFQYQFLFGSDFYFSFARANAQTAPQEIMLVGLADATLTGQPANSIGLRAVATAAKVDFFAECRAAGVDGTTVDSTILEDTAIHFVHLHLTSQNSATVTLDSGSALNLTSGCPATSVKLTPVFYMDTSEATGKTWTALYWEWDATVTRP